MSSFLSVFVTVSSREEAQNIARAVVEEKLAACANILPGVQSVYRWQDKVELANEAAMILKTTSDKFVLLEKRLTELHSYDCPCIIAWPISTGNKAYLDWIDQNTQ